MKNKFWNIWIFEISILLLLRYLVIPNNEQLHYLLFNSYIIPTWIGVIIISFIKYREITGYLAKNHPLKWNEMSKHIGVGMQRRVKMEYVFFCFDNNHFDDSTFKVLKDNYVAFWKLGLTIFVTMPLLFFIIVVR